MKIRYKVSITGIKPSCPHGKNMKVGSSACKKCKRYHGGTYEEIGTERTKTGRIRTLFGGIVDCRPREVGKYERG